MGPIVLNEHQVSCFKFWFGDAIYDGMSYRDELFRQLRTFPREKRDKVYSLGYALAERDVPAVITRSAESYVLWVSLRAPWDVDVAITTQSTERQLMAAGARVAR